ncbi:putative transferring glycosyl group transferase [Cucumis melo var. makuwa]|uniref:Putative transferring glycosyl group transferase n=1 Tax=Cucumis melo var. makuwa TaxID=1194695 RepID=A0A5D3BBW1_CUCMM|nr:putative transferring glycosyl group transferase [Cucumis melo var. makuwa]
MVGHKRHFLPLLLLVSVSILFFFTHFYSSIPPSFPSNPNPDFALSGRISDPKTSGFTLIVKVLAYNRLDSVSRCLRSIANADYLSDRVHLHVYIDHYPTDDAHIKLNESHRILQFVDQFAWNFGEKIVHYRTGNVGLQAQWLEAWWPSSDNEFAFVVEDDLELSPLYYKFLRSLIVNYYYNTSNYDPSIYGASLQRPRFVPGDDNRTQPDVACSFVHIEIHSKYTFHRPYKCIVPYVLILGPILCVQWDILLERYEGKHGNKIKLDEGTRIFLYQIVGTWGQLLFPRPWKEFRLWYDEHKAMGIKPLLDGMVTTGWYKKLGERIWTPWFIKFIHSRGYFNIYTNFLHERALSTSHRDAGVNYGKTAGPDSHLLDESSLDFNLLEMKPLSNLKWYDFCFREVIPQRIVKIKSELVSVLHSVQKHENIIIVSIFGVSESTMRNFLCHFERLNIKNYILLGHESELLNDLTRRGHPVIYADQFLKTLITSKFTTFEGTASELVKLVLAKFYIIRSCLELGYSPGLVDGNMLFVNGDPFTDLGLADDVVSGQSYELFFIKSSSFSQKMWASHMVVEAEAILESLMSRGSSSLDGISFVGIATKLLEKHGVKFKTAEEKSFGLNIGNNPTNTSLGDGKRLVFWPAETSNNDIQKRLEELGFWIIDGDLTCKAVYCNGL